MTLVACEDTRRKVAVAREAQLAKLAEENERMRETLEVIAGNHCYFLEYAKGIARATLDGGRFVNYRMEDLPF